MPEDAVAIARLLQAAGVDIIDVSAGQTSKAARPLYGRMFQTPFSDPHPQRGAASPPWRSATSTNPTTSTRS
jgi:2,4-dienoyl-CoA reductase-like NADH-dependent reductase (Old Yellow Enzyme family)